jgi:hypothetical protein
MTNSRADVWNASQLEAIAGYQQGKPMETVKQVSTDGAAFGSPMFWHFRALPQDVQRVTIRRLALSGLGHEEIAMRTGLPQEAVRRAISEDECLRTLVQPSFGLRWLHSARSGSPAN